VDTLARGFGLAEAPVWDGDALLFSDVLSGGVYQLVPGGRPELLVPKRRGVGGMALDIRGELVMSGRDVVVGDRVVLGHEPGVSGYNDLGTLADGTLLAGVLHFNPGAGEAPQPGSLARVGPDGAIERTPLPEIAWPNGIAAAPDGEHFYLADFTTGTVWRDAREPFVTTTSGNADGLAVDVEGAVLVALGAGAGVARYTADGSLDSVIELPGEFVSSVCFGGPHLTDLVVTTAGKVLRIHVDVPGLAVSRARI
jgi:gluconolactonase